MTKKFDMVFEDIRRESTPVSAAGFGDMVEEPENPDEAFVDVDLEAEDPDKAVSVAKNDDDAAASAKNEDDTDADKEAKNQRREVLEARRKADQLEQDLDEGRAEFAGEVNALKKKVATLEAEKAVDAIEDEYSSEEERLTAEMEQAMEDGDTKKQSKINSELIALNSEKQAKKAAAEASVSVIEDLDGGGDETQPANKRAMQFIRDNETWWSDPDHEDAVTYARKLDKKLVELGFNPDSDAYWTRFNHNFDKKHPDLRKTDPDDIDLDLDPGGDKGGDKASKRNKSPVAQPGGAGGQRSGGGNRSDNNSQSSSSKVRLTAAHKANMVRFHLDPQNPEHCAEYAKQVKATEAADARRAS